MNFKKFFKVFAILLIIIGIGYLIWRFIRKRINKKQQTTEEIPNTENNPPQSTTSTSDEEEETIKPDPSENINKWQDFKFSKKLNEVKINNDIAINENNLLNNPDFDEIFKSPYEDKINIKQDIINGGVQSSDYDYLLSDVSESDSKEIDLNELDNVDNFSERFRDIYKSASIVEDTIPKITLVDTEVFGW